MLCTFVVVIVIGKNIAVVVVGVVVAVVVVEVSLVGRL